MEIDNYYNSDSDLDQDEYTQNDLDYLRNAILTNNNYNEKTKKEQYIRKTSYEVDFKIFKEKFWPKIRSKSRHSALILWTEISAYIKGSALSYTYPGYYLPKNMYAFMNHKTSLLTREERMDIYDLYIEYEKWKVREDAYDFQDIVNYLLYQIKFYGYQGIPIHYMMVDEVQDLTSATLALLLNVTQQKLFFSGDTAQTIAKGVGFRFCDLSNLFNESGLAAPKVCQLTMNFRTHNQILALANSVVSLLESLFPQTIDKMGKEKSPNNGPPPIFIDSGSTEHLFTILFGNVRPQDITDVQFGCNQVIIVRTQDAKSRLHQDLHNALCLTVFESKGLEFDDVILYNFFTDSEISKDKWKILASMELVDTPETSDAYRPQTFDDLENRLPKLRCSERVDLSRYSLLCTELKHLYVAVTRPKVRLVIYDDDPEARFYIQKFWEKFGAINKDNIIDHSQRVNIQGFEAIAQKSSSEAWKAQGLRMMSHKFYDQAAKCFSASGDIFLEKKALANASANKAAEILCEVIAIEEIEHSQTKKMTKKEKNNVRDMKKEAKIMFKDAGELFLELYEQTENANAVKQAARCFASAEDHAKAADLFKESGLIGQAAEAYYICGKFEDAGNLFADKNEYVRAIESYRRGMNWDKLVHTIYAFRDLMSLNDKKKYVQKYVPVALEALMPKILPKAEKETAYINQIIEEDKNAIREVDEEDDSDSEEDVLQDERAEDYQPEDEISINSESFNSEIVQETLHESTCNPETMQDTSQIEQSYEKINQEASENSFSLLDNSSSVSFSIIDSETQSQNFELIADDIDVDPEDEWLQVETGSVVDSLGSAIKRDGSIMSDYSIIDNVHATALNLGGKLIVTKADIFIEDEAMRKIIEYVTMFSQEVTEYLKSSRSAESLVSSQHLTEDWQLASLIDLDDMSQEMLGMVLDTLEDFGMFKMCLIVCNRYHLAARLGRYVTSLAFKYSNRTSLKAHEIFRPSLMIPQAQKAAIAYTAVHNVFEMINPEYLSLKRHKDTKSLGIEGFQGLLLLGYWKKLIYIMDKDNSLAVASTFADFKNYKHIYLTFEAADQSSVDIINKEDFEWLNFDAPKDRKEIEAAKLALDSVINRLKDNQLALNNVGSIKFPSYFKLNESYWKFMHKPDVSFENDLMCSFERIKMMYNKKDLELADELEIWDLFSFYSQVCKSVLLNKTLRSVVQDLNYDKFQEFLETSCILLNFLSDKLKTHKNYSHYSTMIFALLAPFSVRQITPSEVTSALSPLSHCLVNKSSNLLESISISEINDVFVADIEGQNLLIPLKYVKKALLDDIISNLAFIIKGRSKKLESFEFSADEFL